MSTGVTTTDATSNPQENAAKAGADKADNNLTEQLSLTNGNKARQRTLTEKGREEKNRRLKGNQTAALSAVLRKRTELTRLMADETNLHLVKTELSNMNALFEHFQETYNLHYDELSSEGEQDRENQRYDTKRKSLLEFRKQVKRWITQAENRLTDQVDCLSDAGSRMSRASSRSRAVSTASSTASARAKEKAKVAELLAERAMLKKKQVFLAAQEELKLELAIAKTQAREKAYAEFMEEQNRQTADDFKHPYELPSPSAAPSLAMTSAPPALPTHGNFSPQSSECDHHDLPRPPGAAVPLLNRTATAFHPVDPRYTSETHNSIGARNVLRDIRDPNSSVLSKQAIGAILTLQQQQNQQVIATHQQLAAAMTLPQPEVPTFKGDSIDYKTFIMAFTARVESKTTNSADRLYYLDQHIQGEPNELIGGYLHLDPEEGYKEARRLLDKEYVSHTAYSVRYFLLIK